MARLFRLQAEAVSLPEANFSEVGSLIGSVLCRIAGSVVSAADTDRYTIVGQKAT